MEMMRKEFSELKTVTADQLMYVKEDLILPQHYTFYDFIVTKVQRRSYIQVTQFSTMFYAL
jgi:protein FAM50